MSLELSLSKPSTGFESLMMSAPEKKGDESKLYDVIIVGSGPAGFTAGIYAARAGLQTLIITGYTWGGQPMITTLIENYPGFPDGVDGPELMSRMRKQVARFGVEFIEEDATKIVLDKRPFEVHVGNKIFRGKSFIIATGAKHRELGLEAEKRLLGRGVSYCATCDGYFFKNLRVAVVGGGDAALTDALYLSSIAKTVYLIHRRDQFRATKYLQDRIAEHENIKTIMNTIVIDILGEEKVTGLKLLNKATGEESILDIDGVFIVIGYDPAVDLVKDQLELTEEGFIKTHGFTKTSVDGVFAAGDVMDPKYQQLVTAAAFGAMAAMEAEKYLRSSQ